MNAVESMATHLVPARYGRMEPLDIRLPVSPVTCITTAEALLAATHYNFVERLRAAARTAQHADVGRFQAPQGNDGCSASADVPLSFAGLLDHVVTSVL